ncbi:MAG: SDR family oxidoreductase [Thermoguttaceae bacterium]|nr:SDR family oxidoreductase [Thermoguttaceae bacterium]
MIDLTGKVALVTGSSRGLGRATAIRLAEAGADVVVNYVTSQSAARETAEAVASLGRKVWVVRADVGEKEDVDSMIKFIEDTIGRLDIIVSNAATGGFRPLLKATKTNFDAAFHSNVLPIILLSQAAKDLLWQSKERGKIVAVSSHGSFKALHSYGLIGASKAALEATVRHLTLELGEHVNVNVVLAGLLDTDSGRKLPGSDQMFASVVAHSMVGNRTLKVEDVANAILFLASPLADMVQGATLIVDGGSAIHA